MRKKTKAKERAEREGDRIGKNSHGDGDEENGFDLSLWDDEAIRSVKIGERLRSKVERVVWAKVSELLMGVKGESQRTREGR